MSEPGIVSVLWIQTVTRFLDALGADPTPLLSRFGLSLESVERSDEWVPFATFVELQELAAEALDDPLFGLRMGLSYEPNYGGPLGYSMMHAATVRRSLEMVIRYQAMHLRGATLRLNEAEDTAVFSYHVEDDSLSPRYQDSLAAIATGVRMIQCLGFPRWTPAQIFMEHEPRECDSVLPELLGARISFSQPRNALVFEQHILDQPVHGADPGLGSVLERHLELLSRRPPRMSVGEDTLVSKVREAVAAELYDGEPGLEHVARSLAMSGRTLQRELRKRSTAFRELVEDLRRDLALEYMGEPDTAVTQIAFMLGYSELSAFDRAFRRWTGTSPQAHRRRLLS